jgi:hypothetical protein
MPNPGYTENSIEMESNMSSVNGITSIHQDNAIPIKSGIKTGVSNKSFSSYLNEAQSMDSIFEDAAAKYNVPANLLKAVGKTESNFNERAVSRCGAQGVMQLMPSTAVSLGVTDSFDARQNIMGGAKYISGLLKKYNGNTSLALAAYNAGSGNVSKYGGIPPFKETQNYVVKVTRYMNQGVGASGKTVPQGNTAAPVPTPPSSLYDTVPALQIPDITTDNVADAMNSIFSEADYLKLLDTFFEETDQIDNPQEEQQNQAEE